MPQITQEDLLYIGGARSERAKYVTEQVVSNIGMLDKYGINTPIRIAHFLGQIAHESGHFQHIVERASGSAYEGRNSLGNTQKGDGKRFKGRGLIQLTGRNNYRWIGGEIGVDLENTPSKAEAFPLALETACAYWRARRLNEIADTGNVRKVTLQINGGYNGLRDRYLKFGSAGVVVLGLASLEDFQADNDLVVDGVCGEKTAQALCDALRAMPAIPIIQPEQKQEAVIEAATFSLWDWLKAKFKG